MSEEDSKYSDIPGAVTHHHVQASTDQSPDVYRERLRMTTEQQEILAKIVQRFDLLYNPKNPNVKDAARRDRAWYKIDEAMRGHPEGGDFGPEACRKTWKNMFDYYRRKRLADDNGIRKWKYYPSMQFLDNFIHPSESSFNNSMLLAGVSDINNVISDFTASQDLGSISGLSSNDLSNQDRTLTSLLYQSSSSPGDADTYEGSRLDSLDSISRQGIRRPADSAEPIGGKRIALNLEDPVDGWVHSLLGDFRRIHECSPREWIKLRRSVQNAVLDGLEVVEMERDGRRHGL